MANLERIAYIVLRFIAFGTTLSATIIMASSHDNIGFLTFSFQVKYTDSPAFVYFVIANAVVSVYGFLVLFLPSESLLWRLVVALDLVFTILLSSSISAALAIAQVGKKGNSYAGWLPVCGQVSRYCDQVTAALATGSIAVIVYMMFVLHSIHTVLDPLLLKKTSITKM